MNVLSRVAAMLVLVALPFASGAQQLTVCAAASLTEAFREIGLRFEATRPQVSVRFNFAASGVLIQQIINGAPADVFVSADQEAMDRGMQHKALDPSSRRDFASNSMVVVVPVGGNVPMARVSDLKAPAVRRIAVGKPANVPAGRYAKQVLDQAGLWAALEPRLVFADNVRQVLDYVSRGEVEAGFVYRTDAELMKDRVRVASTASGHAPITYPLAVVADTRHPALAREFSAFLLSADAQAILARFGFGKP